MVILFRKFRSFYKSEKTIVDYQKNGCYSGKTNKWNNCISIVTDEQKPIEGLLCAISKDRVAFYTEGYIQIINSNNNYKVARKYTKNNH